MASFDDVNRIALTLPHTSESPSHGTRSWRVGDKTFVWERPLRKKEHEQLGAAAPEGPILGVHVEDLGAKEALLAEESGVFFTTPHFNGHRSVLVLIERVASDELAELIVEAWLCRAPKRVAREYLESDPPPPR